MLPEGSKAVKELDLFKEIKQDNTAAFKCLFLGYYDKLRAFVLTFADDPFLAEETVQEVFARLWEKRASINIHSSVRYYLYRSCRNTAINLLRKSANQYQRLSAAEDETTAGDNPAELLSYKMLDRQFQAAVAGLPEKAKAVFLLRYYGQSKHKEIARRLGISESMVEKHWANALRILQKKLAAHFFQ